MRKNVPLSEPPEGVVSGDSIPRENEEHSKSLSKLDKMVSAMKSMPEYHNMSDDEVREIAEEKLKRMGEL